MIFFTDITTSHSNYCLLHISHYNDSRKFQKKLIFVDPGVYQLKKSNEYIHIQDLHYLTNQLLPNEYISIDYPCDMNLQFKKEFLAKSIANNQFYKDNLRYICTIQFNFMNYQSFLENLNHLEQIWHNHPGKILGIGNLCRVLQPNVFTDYAMALIRNRLLTRKIYWLHFYGLSLKCMRKYIPYLEKTNTNTIISCDSTKWTKAVTTELKQKYGLNCRKKDRDTFFDAYIKEIQEFTNVIY